MQQNRRRAPRVGTRNGRGGSGMNAQPGGRAATRILVPALVLSVCAAAAQAQTTPNLNSNGLLQPFNTLLGSTALTTNLQTAISINNASTAAQRDAYSVQNAVSEGTPPVFLCCAGDDGTVPPVNSLLMYRAMLAAGQAAELHAFAKGGHGFGVRLPKSLPASHWPDLFMTFAESQGFSA